MYQPNFERIAQKIVRGTLNIQPGEHLVLLFRNDAMPFAEWIAVEAYKAGGLVTLLLGSDELKYQEMQATPLAQLTLAREPERAAMQASNHLVLIGISDAEPERFRDVPVERATAWEQRRVARRAAIQNSGARKVIGTDVPTRYMMHAPTIPWSRFHEVFWRAMDTDYGLLRERATALAELLEGGDELHLTTPRGTDLRMRRGGRRITKDDGQFDFYGNLPAGEVYLAPLETSVEGRVVFDRAFHGGQRISLLEMHFEGGIGTPLGAAEGFDVFMERWIPATGDKNRIGELGIGINPEVRAPTGSILLDDKIIGTVHLGLGFNEFIGGANVSTLHWNLILLNPTLTLDGRPILKAGRVMLP